MRQNLAFPIADANGGARTDRSGVDGRFENRIQSELGYDPRSGRYSLLKVPLPLPVGTDEDRLRELYPQERLVVDEGLAALTPPVVVFRRAETWKPYMPDYVLDNRLTFNGEDAGGAEHIVVFAHIEPKDLLRLLGALRDVDVTSLLEDRSLIEKLQKLSIKGR